MCLNRYFVLFIFGICFSSGYSQNIWKSGYHAGNKWEIVEKGYGEMGGRINGELVVPCKYATIVFEAADESDQGVFKCCHSFGGDDFSIYDIKNKCYIPNNLKWGDQLRRLRDPIDKSLFFGINWLSPESSKTTYFQYIAFEDGKAVYPYSGDNINVGITKVRDNDGNLFFHIVDHGKNGIKDAKGNWLIPIDMGFREISLFKTNKGAKFYRVRKGDYPCFYGLYDGKYEEIISPELEFIDYIGGDYFSFKSNGYWGVLNSKGEVIIPTSRHYTSIGRYTTLEKRIPYTMKGFKGECNHLGQQVSKMKVATPVATPTPTTPKKEVTKVEETPQKQEEKKIIIEHKHDPVPMQVWKQCTGCYGSGMCQSGCGGSGWFTGYSGNSTRCIGCGGSGKCQFCAGSGGHYEVEYR